MVKIAKEDYVLSDKLFLQFAVPYFISQLQTK